MKKKWQVYNDKRDNSSKDITVISINIYTPNIGVSKYIKQLLTGLKGETDSSNTIIVGNFKCPTYISG